MPSLVLTDPVNGTTTDADVIAANNAAIKALVNGALANDNISGTAGIAYAKLALTGNIVNADISAAAAIAISKLASYPSLSTAYLRGDGFWTVIGRVGTNTTTVTVNTTVAETSLLAGVLSVSANTLSTNRVAKFTAFGDWKNNSGGTQSLFRFKFKFGGIAYVDTGVLACALPNSATQGTWRVEAEVIADGATNAQSIQFKLFFVAASATAATQVCTTGFGYSTSTAQGFINSLIFSAGAKDTTSGQTVDLTVIPAANNVNLEIRCHKSYLEISG